MANAAERKMRRFREWVGEDLVDEKGLSYQEWDDLFASPAEAVLPE